jgi:hypothetical protein
LKAKELISKLPIVQENILAEAAIQPQLFMSAAEYRILKMQKVSQTGIELEAAKAKIALKIRATKDDQGKKPTEGYVAQRTEAQSSIKQKRLEYEQARTEDEFAKLILEAYRHRRDAIRIIADVQMSQGGHNKELNRIVQRYSMGKQARELEERRSKHSDDE